MGVEWIYGLMVILPSLLLVVMVIFGIGDDGGDLGGGDIEAELEVEGGMEAGDISEAGGPGFLGIKLIFSFIIGFGLAGFLAYHYQWPIPHILAGLIGGVIVYSIVYQLLKVLYKQQANTLVSSASVVGKRAVVTSALLKGGTGEVKAEDPRTGSTVYLRARAVDPEKEYRAGEEVTITTVFSGLAKIE